MNAYLVGGPVRDLCLKNVKGDLDITVEGDGMAVAKAFASQQGGTLTRYPAFKTATVALPRGRQVDFATARKEKYVRPGAFPAVTASHIQDDLFRRDFSINAMAVAITPRHWGEVRDPFDGRKDLRAKKIRVLHEDSFIDDPTRILRAARFQARLGFTVERHTLTLLKNAVRQNALDSIRPQRYQKEYKKILQEPASVKAIKLLSSWEALREVPHVTHGQSQ